ncbi:helix-turn-helix transcriptional regulator [Thalassovita aquimarina]|uniref:AlpA family phage regulatory protein n=1 Tax=Thalassovita aquimarina TaxID=2785917 RepID=A0ABS5HNT0_9RHOB|nr:AlpA family phage regulatory protein [Thalassovita aquimarina]MBR9650600.1 AlpA family phage regulatory protein [Thalassovita aquimarina]
MNDRILRRQEVEGITGLSRSSIYRLLDCDRFPAPIRLTERRIGWRQSAIEAWIRERETI